MTPVSPPPRPGPRNLGLADLSAYRLPLPGIVSILHRASGALLFLTLPASLWLFEMSLSSEVSYARLVQFATPLPVRLALLVLFWALAHHACAGVRFLLLDLHIGGERLAARRGARLVLAASLALTALAAVGLLAGGAR